MFISRLLLAFGLIYPTIFLTAQSDIDDRAAIVKSITKLFDVMEKGDTNGLAAIVHPDLRLMTVARADEIGNQLQESEASRFFEGIAGADAGVLVEQLYQIEIRVDGDLATAWTPYRFVYSGELSHCGVNSFQLVKNSLTGIWQIAHVIDTRRRSGCPDLPDMEEEERLNKLVDDWHVAAAEADSAAYFGAMAEESIFIGTDATEHWTRAEFIEFAAPYFAEGKAWDFTAMERHLFISPDSKLVYWDELLDTWMGPCRGTGIAERQYDGSYLIMHYTLSVTVPNDQIQGFIELTKE